jgi:hypothetical protein
MESCNRGCQTNSSSVDMLLQVVQIEKWKSYDLMVDSWGRWLS